MILKCKDCGAEYELYKCYWRNNTTNALMSSYHGLFGKSDICPECHKKTIADNLREERAI